MSLSMVLRNKLIFVMGMQRSGTTALLDAIGQDPAVRAENEAEDGPIYDQYRLRPEPEIRPFLWEIKRRVVLKPVVEVEYRELDAVLDEFIDYDPQVAWIYRDPVNVWASNLRTFDLDPTSMNHWLTRWVEGNRSLLRTLDGPHADRVRVVRYEDLISHRSVFEELCAFLSVRPINNLFWRENHNRGRKTMPSEIQSVIEARTSEIMKALDEVRLRTPPQANGLTSDLIQGPARWELLVHAPAQGTLRAADDPIASEHVMIESISGNEPAEVQLSWGALRLTAGRSYGAAFWARAERPRKINVLLSLNHEPWDALGFSARFDLCEDWRLIAPTFVPTLDTDNARLYLDLAEDTAWIEVSDLVVGSPLFRPQELLLHDGVGATLKPIPPHVESARVIFDEQKRTTSDSSVQLLAGTMKVTQGQHYTVSFQAKSDRPRPVAVAVGQPHKPWESLGLYEVIELAETNAWHAREFIATRTGQARLYFDLGQSMEAIEFDAIEFFPSKERMHEFFVNRGASCQLEFPIGDLSSVRAHVQVVPESPAPSDAQLFLMVKRMTSGDRYAVTFRARAESPRSFGVGVGLAEPPWEGLGLYHNVFVGRTWKNFHYEFTATRSTDVGRILFDIGASDIPIEIAEVSFSLVDDHLDEIERARLPMIALALNLPLLSTQDA